MNGQYSEFRPLIQPQQGAVYVTYDPRRNPQIQSQYAAHEYQRMNAAALQPIRARLTSCDYTGTASWVPIVVPHQSARGKSNTCNPQAVNRSMQNLSSNLQIREPRSQTSYVIQRDFNRISANNSSDCDHSKMTHVLVSATGNQNRAASNQYHGQISTQYGVSPSFPPPPFHIPVSQSYENNTAPLNSPAFEQTLHASGMSQKMHQGSTQLNSVPNHGKEASINSNSYRSQIEPRYISATAPEPPFAPLIKAQTDSPVLLPLLDSGLTGQKNDTQSSTSNDLNSHEMSTSPNTQQHSSQQNMAYTEKKEATPSVVSNPNTPQCRPGPVNAQFDAIAKARKESPLLMQLLDNLTGPKIVTRSSTADGVNTCDMETSVNTNYSIPTSPGHAASKVVCVVQPLSQESYMVPSQNTPLNKANQKSLNTATNEHLSNGENRNLAQAVTENNKAPNSSEQHNSCTLKIQNQSPSSRDCVSLSDSHTLHYFPQKKPCADDSGSKPAVDIQKNHLVPTSEEPESRCGEKDTSELPLDPKSFELSTIPTAQWTVEALTKLIQDGERVQMKSETISLIKTLIEMFWNGNTETFLSKLRSGWYSNLLANVDKFHRGYVTRDSIILSEAKKEHLRHLHVLENDDVYKAPPFASSWLNINEQLDDIDKEFGFPSSLKHHHHAPENHCKEDLVLTVKKVPLQIEREEQNKALSENKPEPEETEENQTRAVEVTSTQTASNNTDVEDTMDEHCSFNTQVLPPEEDENQTLAVEVTSTQIASNNKDVEDSMDEHCSFNTQILPPEEDENQTLAVEVTSTQTASNNTDVEDSMDEHCSFNTQVLPPEDDENQTLAVEDTSTQNASPATREYAESRDKYYSFEIQVLDPAEARIIFEENIQNSPVDVNSSQTSSNNTDGADSRDEHCSFEIQVLDPEEARIISEENQQGSPVDVNSAQTSSNNTDDADSGDEHCSFEIQVLPPEEAKMIFEEVQNMISQSRETCSLQNGDTNTSVGINSEFIDLTSDSTESRTLPEIENSLDSNMSPFSKCKPTKEDLTCDMDGNIEHDNQQFAVKPKSKCHEEEESPEEDGKDHINVIPEYRLQEEVGEIINIDDDQDSIIFISEDEEVSSGDNKFDNPLPDHDEDSREAQQESAGSDPSTSSALSDERQVIKNMLHLKADCGDAALTSSPEPASCQTTPIVGDKEEVQKRKRKKRHDAKLALGNKMKKHKTQFVTDSAPSGSEVRRVKLALFGSSEQPAFIGCHEHKSFLQTLHSTPRPPRALYVNLSPVKRNPPASPQRDYPVPKLIYEPQSLSPTGDTHGNKPMSHTRPSNGPRKHKELSGFNSKSLSHGKAKRLMNVERKNPSKVGRRAVFKLKSLDCDRIPVVPPLCDENPLKFSVLPETFTFKDGCKRIEETTDHVSDKPELGSKDNMVGLTLKSTRGQWYPDSEKKHCPLSLPPIHKSSSVFTEFQRKYKEKMHPVLSV